MVASLAENPYFSAGFGLFGVGAGAAILRKGYMVGNKFVATWTNLIPSKSLYLMV